MPEIPTAYGGLVISSMFAGKAVLFIAACGLGMEYIAVRLLTHRLGIKSLPWLFAFAGVHIVSWPLATFLIMALGDSRLMEQIADTAGLWFVIPFAIGFEVLVGAVEGIAYGMIFSKTGTLRKRMIASVIGNIVGFIAGFAASSSSK
jgi:hypothetical protein